MDDSFHFALLRISISQILKANGFDKCKPSTLNTLTDIYIQQLNRLSSEAVRLSQLRTRSNNVNIQDVTEAFKLTGTIKTENYLKLDDTKDSEKQNASSLTKRSKSEYNTMSLESFRDWLKYSDSFRVSKKLNELPNSLIKNLMEKRKLVLDDGETDQEKKKRKHKERQDYYNQLKLNEVLGHSSAHSGQIINGDDMEDDDLNDGINDRDRLLWLNYLIEKDLKLGHDLKFINTSLYNEYLKFQTNTKFHPVMKSNDKNGSRGGMAKINDVVDRYQQLKKQVNNINKYDYIVMGIEDEQPEIKEGTNPEETEVAQVVRPSEELENILPYNLKYESYLVSDELDQFLPQGTADENSADGGEINIKYEPGIEHDTIPEDDFGGKDNSLMF